MPRTQKTRSWIADRSRQAQIKVRLPEVLRRHLEREAASRGHSMNAEIIKRLSESFRVDQTTLIANALLSGLDDDIVNKMVDIVMRDRAAEDMADLDADLGLEPPREVSK